MHKTLPMLVTAFCLVFISPAAARDIDSCDSYPDVPINITPVFDEPKYDNTQNLESLQNIVNDRRHSIPTNHSITMGITRYEPVLAFQVPIVVRTPPSGLVCAFVQHVDVTVGYRNVTVFVANEIPQNSCGYNETLAHEEKHIDVNRDVLRKFTPLIEERFKAYLKLNGVLQVQNADYAQKIISDKLQEIIEDIIGQMEQENLRQQREVDTPGEYHRLSMVCNGSLGQIADQFRRRYGR